MSSNPHQRFYAARLAGTTVFDPLGDAVAKIRDVVVVPQPRTSARAVGFVVEVGGKRRVFLPITRVTSINPGQVISTGLLNVRRFEKRAGELLVIGDLLDRVVTLNDGSGEATVEDIALDRNRQREWELSRLHVRRLRKGGSLSRLMSRGETLTVGVSEVTGLYGTQAEQSAALLAASYQDLNPADLAEIMQELDAKRRIELAGELADERLADVLEELPEDTRVEMITGLEAKRAADVLDEMDPDDAADLMQELPDAVAESLLDLMEPEEAEDVRRLLAYDVYTAGGMMTTEPLIVAPETSVAHCLAMISREEVHAALASTVHVCRAPLETPTGRLLGIVHFQLLLRERPDRSVGEILDQDKVVLSPSSPLSQVTREMATYNLVSIPVVDEDGHLLGAVTVDDVLDHVLPDDWREQDEAPVTTGQIDLSEIARGTERT
ncbi:CBS domain-containing protein [Brachybacterium muris]|uniref:Magnesium transporter n=1 Tax=Brachybacterium muris UCD-AY4 TaxID=1249481 RepID=A0A022L287_9MICO|nr:CBS domain-containing protein [Brachybacterium muris]EYT50118.1 magnesium transporter [Brachybacterium muris UCD-AY4]MBM7500047.1 CBS domain-containing protein [Brachybacterium muris]MCT1655188.1 CBS domain-containing protein [Brachybacterium muris]MCT1998800.1 CBS domain-containing protein [Brachybacterium muris]MCT2176917.1 CBS domain-containing protein [Brachybacterium muris]